MNMPSVFKCSVGSAISAPLKQRIKLTLKHNILRMALFILMVSTDPNGFSATNAKKHITSTVYVQTRKNQQNGLSYAALMSASSKRVMIFYLKRVIFKRVTISVLVAKQKSTKKKFKRGKDSRKIGIRRAASSGKNNKEQQWSEKDMDKAFDLWEANENLKPEQRKSKRQISIETGIPYTTLCERLSGRRGGGRRGKIAGGKRQSKVLSTGKCKPVIKQVRVSDFQSGYPLDRLRS